jgi:hypothetical protein
MTTFTLGSKRLQSSYGGPSEKTNRVTVLLNQVPRELDRSCTVSRHQLLDANDDARLKQESVEVLERTLNLAMAVRIGVGNCWPSTCKHVIISCKAMIQN